jgi:hypothetical protein
LIDVVIDALIHKPKGGVERNLFAGLSTSHANDVNKCPPNPSAPSRSPQIQVPRSINPGSRPRNAGEIHPPVLSVQLMTVAQETPAWMKKG